MIRRPLIHQALVTRRPRQQHPTRAAGKRLAYGSEFAAPALHRAEIAPQGGREVLARRALFAKAVEEELVEDHRVGGNKLLALEAVDEEIGCRIKLDVSQLLGNEVEALHSAAVVVLVVADDQLLGHALDVLRIA